MKRLTIFLSLFLAISANPLTHNAAIARAYQVSSIVDYQTVLILPKGDYYIGYTQISLSFEQVKNLAIDFNGESVFDIRVNNKTLRKINFMPLLDKTTTPRTVDIHKDGVININAEEFEGPNGKIHTILIGFRNPYSRDGNGLHSMIDGQGQQFIYCQNEPFWFNKIQPAIDQPDIKGKMKFTLITSSEWEVVSNSSVEKTVDLDNNMKNLIKMIDGEINTRVTYKMTVFEQTGILPTYLFNFAVGDFHVISYSPSEEIKEVTKKDLKIYVTKSLTDFAENQKDDIFKVMRLGLKYYNNYFDNINPQEKLALIFCPEYSTGAMEYPGSITINDSYIFQIANPKPSSLFMRANTILHELAHLWFGDTVTMIWWNDLWLNESFATFMSYMALDSIKDELNYKDIDVWVDFAREKSWGYDEDVLSTTHPVTHDVKDTDEAKNSFDGITYSKGAAILRMIHKSLTPKIFRAKINDFIRHFEFSNASYTNLVSYLVENDQADLVDEVEAFRAWTNQMLTTKGINSLKIREIKNSMLVVNQESTPENSRLKNFELSISCFKLDDSKVVESKLDVFLGNVETNYVKFTSLNNPLRNCPAYLLNSDDENYVRVKLDNSSTEFLMTHFNELPSRISQFVTLRSLYDVVIDIEINPKEFLDYILGLNFTTLNGQIFDSVVDYASSVMYNYLKEVDLKIYAHKMFIKIQDLIESLKKREIGLNFESVFNGLLAVALHSDDILYMVKYLDPAIEKLSNKINQENNYNQHLSIRQIYRIVFKAAGSDANFDYDKYLVQMKALDLTENNNEYRIAIEHLRLKDIPSRDAAWKLLKKNSGTLSHTKFEMALVGFFSIFVDKELKQPYYDDAVKNFESYVTHMPYTEQLAFINSVMPTDDHPENFIIYFDQIVRNANISAGARVKIIKLNDISKRRRKIFMTYSKKNLKNIL